MPTVSKARDGSGTTPPSQARRWLQAVAGLLVLAGAVAIAWVLIRTKPSTRRKPRAREAQTVEVVEVSSVERIIDIEASGTVVPAHAVDLRPEVSGRVNHIGKGLVPGAVLKKGDVIAALDPRDLQIAVTKARAALSRARAGLELEQGSQRVAKAELEAFDKEHPNRKRDEDLALRKPQLATARADVAEARAALAEAQLDASRTQITAPFDAMLRTRAVAVGMYVTPTTSLAALVGTDTWWIEVAVPKAQLRWLGREGATVRIYDEAAWGPDVYREGRVLEVGAEVVDGGRLVKAVVAVDDPLGLETDDAPKMILGSWARVQIAGGELEAVELDRHLLRDGDTVWVMNADDELDVRTVTIAARGRETVFVIDGLANGERVVSSALRPVPGMKLREQGGGRSTEARR
jgi:RND family efflux transporter MFP subunit